tara:strand:+ start:181 stop:732 length:552 start_codon:yes stop_codon:yes gene_type:complete
VNQWIIFIAFALPAAGCLLPPPVDEASELVNLAPRIVPESLTPDPTEGPKVMSTACESYPFFARITDPDRNDTLYWRVFLDYHRDDAPVLTEVQVLTPDPNSLVSVDLIQFNVSPNDELLVGGGRLNEPHMVELLVSDRPFNEAPIEPEGRVIQAEEGLTDSFIWTVEITDEPRPCPAGGARE